jgi:hypothetical protein
LTLQRGARLGDGTVTLSFPAEKAKAGTPDGCYGAPVATSDGQGMLWGRHLPVNAGGATEVGLWVFSARTGMLTAEYSEGDRSTVAEDAP